MTVRADQAPQIVIPGPLRWLAGTPAWAAGVAALNRLREHLREPRVEPMSDDWLRRHAADREYSDSL